MSNDSRLDLFAINSLQEMWRLALAKHFLVRLYAAVLCFFVRRLRSHLAVVSFLVHSWRRRSLSALALEGIFHVCMAAVQTCLSPFPLVSMTTLRKRTRVTNTLGATCVAACFTRPRACRSTNRARTGCTSSLHLRRLPRGGGAVV